TRWPRDWSSDVCSSDLYQSMPAAEVNAAANARTLLILMIETPQAVENADAIAAVPGFDVLLIGSSDLSTEMGIAGQFRHERMLEIGRASGRERGEVAVG